MGDFFGVRRATVGDVKLAAAKTSALLSLLFVVVYGGCSWITAHRTDVGTLYFPWERCIPFVPIFIVPYMSIDLFFIAAPFFCRDALDLRTLRRRISLAILAAGACFLAMPLTLAVPRPQAEGWAGAIFRPFFAIDQPFNLFPSLHVALCLLLADHYARHTRGLLRFIVHGWFALIGISVLFTYQHHVMDAVGGLFLGGLCFYLVPGLSSKPTSMPASHHFGTS